MICIRRQVELHSTEFRAVIVQSEQASEYQIAILTSSVLLVHNDLLRIVILAMHMIMPNATLVQVHTPSHTANKVEQATEEMESQKLILVKAEMMEIMKTEMDDQVIELQSQILHELKKHLPRLQFEQENEIISLATTLDTMNVRMGTTLLLMADIIDRLNLDGNVLTEVRGTLMFALNFEATVLTMVNMNVTMAIITMETVDLQHAQSNKTAIKISGFVVVVIKKRLIFVMSGEVTVSGLKIRGSGTRDETCLDCKKLLEMMATSEVVKDVMEYEEQNKALFDRVGILVIQMFEVKIEAIDEPSIMINEMMVTMIVVMVVIVNVTLRQEMNAYKVLLTMSACVLRFVETI